MPKEIKPESVTYLQTDLFREIHTHCKKLSNKIHFIKKKYFINHILLLLSLSHHWLIETDAILALLSNLLLLDVCKISWQICSNPEQ